MIIFVPADSHDVDAHRVMVEGDVHADSAQHCKQNNIEFNLITANCGGLNK
jgi:hypothetical protein